MKKIIIPFLSAFLLFSCGSKNNQHEDDLSEEEITNLEATSLNTIEEIQYKGKFEGTIKNKKVELTINDEKFNLTENGKEISGKWAKVDDGNTIELIPEKGKLKLNFMEFQIMTLGLHSLTA